MSDDDGRFADTYADYARKFLDTFLSNFGERTIQSGLRQRFADVIAADATDEQVAAMVDEIVAIALLDDLRLAVDVDDDVAGDLGQIIHVIWGERPREDP